MQPAANTRTSAIAMPILVNIFAENRLVITPAIIRVAITTVIVEDLNMPIPRAIRPMPLARTAIARL